RVLDRAGPGLRGVPRLNGRHGLTKRVPQAEGIAMDDEGTLYLVSEPNLFYVFKKTTP
ncbi:SdiA-regulated domain-containing protein, partial [Pseudomonas lurida]|uniref:SdiA-regulated domain-containing protein n=1 Tax=Pseudomonas lurida TaxID=244566 RepID=UPI0016549BFE